MLHYSFIASRVPLTSITLDHGDYYYLPKDVKSKCIVLEERIEEVSKFLSKPSAVEKYAGTFDNAKCPIVKTAIHDDTLYAKKNGKRYMIDISNYPIFYCTLAAEEIAKLFVMDVISWNRKEMENNYIPKLRNIVPEQITNLRGVYMFNLTHRIEEHGFVLGITNDNITVFNTYGGYYQFFVKKFDRSEWCRDFTYFFTADVDYQKNNYHKIFGFTKEMTRDVIFPRLEADEPIRIISLEFTKVM